MREAGAPDRQGDVKTLIRDMDTNGVDHAVVVQAPWFMDGHREYLKAAASMHPGRLLSGLLINNPGDMSELDALAQMDTSDVVGIRLHLLDAASRLNVLSDTADRFFDWCAAHRIPVTLLFMEYGHANVVRTLAQRFPNLSLVLDHMGWLRAADDPSPVCELARYKNLSVKLSGHVVLSESEYPYRDLWPQQRRLLESFGADRLMWASNFPMPVHREATYQQRLLAVAELPFITDDDRIWILGETGRRMWLHER